jgi:hypothetical protein
MATTPRTITIHAHRGACGKPPVMRQKVPNRPGPGAPLSRRRAVPAAEAVRLPAGPS